MDASDGAQSRRNQLNEKESAGKVIDPAARMV
jgi:hypothetical protein